LDERSGRARWKVGDDWCFSIGLFAHAGWPEYTPSYPPTFDQIQPYCHDADQRVAWMDRHGIAAQVLYPNLIAFEAQAMMRQDRELSYAIVRAYNDYQAEFAAAHPDRYVLLASLPFWDRDESVKELERCFELGFKGVVWAATLARLGLPATTDPYWDPIYARAQEMGLSINFHVGAGGVEDDVIQAAEGFDPAQWAGDVGLAFMSNSRTITDILMKGLCRRFPTLNFVSVESGFGFVPFLIEALDWQWKMAGLHNSRRDWMLPSEYFRRQVSLTMWFEQTTLALLPDWADNVMFETDFPHSTSLSPGPGSPTPEPRTLVEGIARAVGPEVLRKVMYENAARIYHL
jgi:predicted TIM-barrel fold metal-dependent hydrolase